MVGATESYIPTLSTDIPEGQTNEDRLIQVDESWSGFADFKDYFKEQSFNMKTVVEHFEVDYQSMNMSKDGKYVTLTEAQDPSGLKRTAIIKTDDYIQKELSSMFRHLY